jgi:hypothetical protein
MKRNKSSSNRKWAEIIDYAEAKLKRSRLRVNQLEALIAVFRANCEAGEACPTELARSVQEDRKGTALQ